VIFPVVAPPDPLPPTNTHTMSFANLIL
jgi:hypothetical protein